MRAVIDTNVVFEGLGRRGPCGRVVDRWVERAFIPCVSTALALEYEDVLVRGKSGAGRETMRKALQALLVRAEFVPVLFTYRPVSPDPDDDHVVDCVMNAGARLVTSNTRDFRDAAATFGFVLDTPESFLAALEEE